MTLRIAVKGLSAGIVLVLLVGCGGGGGSSGPTTTPPPMTSDFTLSSSPSTLNVSRGTSGDIQVSVAGQNGFTGTVTITPTGLPTGLTSAPVDVAAGSTGTLTLQAAPLLGSGPFTISLAGTSGTLSHSASVTLTVPFGGGVLTIVPRISGQYAMPQVDADYINLLEADVAPVRLKDCGSASSSLEFDMVNNPADSTSTHPEGPDHFINIQSLPVIPGNGNKDFTQYTVYETAHALQYDLLRNVTHRATQADIEGFSETCSDIVYRDLALAGKGNAPKDGGATDILWFDTLRRVDPESIAAASWLVGTSNAYFQSEMSIGEGSLLLAFTQKDTGGSNGLVAHENAIFAEEFATDLAHPLTPSDRRRAWDSTGIMLDGKSAGAWMPEEMIDDPVFSVGRTHLVAWPVYPQFPAQMMAHAFTVTAVTSSDNSTELGGLPTTVPVTSGALTITVKDAAGHVVLTKSADFSQTADIGGYTPNLQNLPQGTYTVFVDATVNSTALEQHFVVANIPFDKTGVGGSDLAFPGQYLVAVDSAGNANGGTLNVTRGTLVWSMSGFAIVKPDSTGTFDVTGPSGTKHTYTAPTPWA